MAGLTGAVGWRRPRSAACGSRSSIHGTFSSSSRSASAANSGIGSQSSTPCDVDVGREADADAVHADCIADRFEHLAHEAQPVLDRSAIFVGAEIGAVAKELIDQIAVGAVDLDAVEPGGDRVAGGADIIADDAADVAARSRRGLRRRASCLHRCGHRSGAVVAEETIGCAAAEVRVHQPPHVPQLRDDPAASAYGRRS